MIRRSRAVIVICQHLGDTVRAIEPDVPTVLIENAPGSGDTPVVGIRRRGAASSSACRRMRRWSSTPAPSRRTRGSTCSSTPRASSSTKRPDTRFVLAGGRPDQIASAQAAAAAAAGLGASAIFAGQRPAEEIPSYLDAADLLVSPRSSGTNTPLKIYQYLRSGRAIVATRLLTHTQVLDDAVAILTPADAAGFAAGILSGIEDPASRARGW